MTAIDKRTKKALLITAALSTYIIGALWLSVNISRWFISLLLVPLLFLIVLYMLAWIEIEKGRNDNPNKTNNR